MIYLKKYSAIISVIYNIVYFSVPGQVQDLSLKSDSHSISVNWSEPILNNYCVMQYVIYWLHTVNGNINSSIVSSDKDSFLVIENLDACVKYEVSVRAENEKNESSNDVTSNTTTKADGKYHTLIILLCLWYGYT